jgi:HrpA-like RNA helicase
VLIFMPGERDIRETSDLLEGRFGREAEIIPLFGMLSAGDQQRVFAPSSTGAKSCRRHQHRRNVADHSRHPLRD